MPRSLPATRRQVLAARDHDSHAKVSLRAIDGPKCSGLFANRLIAKRAVVAYYPIEVIVDPGSDTRDPLRDYFIEVKHANGHVAGNFVGRPDLRATLASPTRGLSSTGLFANEPSGDQRINTQLDVARTNGELFDGKKLKVIVRAIKPIAPEEEILVCYGSGFARAGYVSSCDCQRCQACSA
jgi:hypothetical protein